MSLGLGLLEQAPCCCCSCYAMQRLYRHCLHCLAQLALHPNVHTTGPLMLAQVPGAGGAAPGPASHRPVQFDRCGRACSCYREACCIAGASHCRLLLALLLCVQHRVSLPAQCCWNRARRTRFNSWLTTKCGWWPLCPATAQVSDFLFGRCKNMAVLHGCAGRSVGATGRHVCALSRLGLWGAPLGDPCLAFAYCPCREREHAARRRRV